jgi:hypothetical protein
MSGADNGVSQAEAVEVCAKATLSGWRRETRPVSLRALGLVKVISKSDSVVPFQSKNDRQTPIRPTIITATVLKNVHRR